MGAEPLAIAPAPIAETILATMRELHAAALEYEAVKHTEAEDEPFWRMRDLGKTLAAMLRREGINPNVIGEELL